MFGLISTNNIIQKIDNIESKLECIENKIDNLKNDIKIDDQVLQQVISFIENNDEYVEKIVKKSLEEKSNAVRKK